jgi:hypothetical protein
MTRESDATGEAFDITSLARSHAPAALEELARLAKEANSETARIAAIREILALACGKAEKAADNGGPLTVRIVDDWARPPP